MIGRNEALCKVSMTSDRGTGLRERSRDQFFEGRILVAQARASPHERSASPHLTSKGLGSSAQRVRTITVLASGPILGRHL
jgi:hypothetical protein